MEHKQNYSRGKPITTLTCRVLPLESKGTKGTSIRFWPDKEGFACFPLLTTLPKPKLDLMINFPLWNELFSVFTTAIEFDHNTIAGRIRELAFLNPKVKLLYLKHGKP